MLVTGHGLHTAAASRPTSSRLDFVLPLGPDSEGQESEADACATLPHLNPIHALVIFITLHSSSNKALWRRASDQAAGVDTLGAVAADLHTGGSGHMVVYHWNSRQQWNSAAP